LNDTIIVRAAEIYGQLYRTGNLIGDADILIAATCLENGHALATNNTAH
jgi:tRNA(fMet)-specific endonuclease VapC